MLFGHQNDDTNQAADNSPVLSGTAVDQLAAEPTTPVILPTAPDPMQPMDVPTLPAAPALNQTTAPAVEPALAATPVASTAANDDILAPATSNDELLQLKQQALQQLSPLVGHLEQSPEEKFRTTMMMIQSSDNQALIKDAYAAAQAITDDKSRAQALLDIVNEINYFTQQTQGN